MAPPKPPPIPKQEVKPVAGDALSRLEALEAQLNAKLADVDAQAAQYQEQIEHQKVLNARAINQSRVEHLRQIGISEMFTDQQVLSLAPKADPTTVEGRAELDRFRSENAGLFSAPERGPDLTVEDAQSKYKGNKMFTPEKYAANLRDLLKKR